jgi:ABC-2 type transport system ATP-binding protein
LKHQLKLRRADPCRYDELVALADLGRYQHQNVRTLSGGSQRKLHIITAVAHRPDLLILDEPTAGLDPTAQQTLLALLSGLKDDGVGILFASHHRDELVAMADSLLVLHQGRQIKEVSLEVFTGANGRTVLALEPFDTAALPQLKSWASGLPASHSMIQTVVNDGTTVQVELVAGEYPDILGQLVAQAYGEGFTLRAATYQQPSLADIVRSITN